MTTRTLRLYQRDAFTRDTFRGNPAAVVPLEGAWSPEAPWPPDAWMQAVAAENNLAETAFFVPRAGPGGAQAGHYDLRWFTPTVEVPLCGHATLAAASVVFDTVVFDTVVFDTAAFGVDGRDAGTPAVTFHTRSGPLTVTRGGAGGRLAMDFPGRPPVPADTPPGLLGALGVAPRDVREVFGAGDGNLYVALAAGAAVRALAPDFARLAGLPPVAVTAPGDSAGDGDGADFVSRYFAPTLGVPEDPVTGSTHCALVPYWAARLGRASLHARQVSRRGGDLYCELRGDRVLLAGHVAPYLEGTIRCP